MIQFVVRERKENGKMNGIKSRLRDTFRISANLLYPPVCPACGIVTGSLIDGELCESCREEFADSFVTVCPRCGMGVNKCTCAPDVSGRDSDRSPYTTVHPLIFSGYYTGFDAEDIVARTVFNFKRDSTCGGGYLFARIIAQSISRYLVLNEISTEKLCVTYIPRSKSAMDEHGFDHMGIVAKEVARMLGIGYDRLLKRKGGTAQKKLTGEERAENASRSITLNVRKTDKIRGGKLLILDDIITTGSTMRSAISKLSFAGAEIIIPASVMIAMKPVTKK